MAWTDSRVFRQVTADMWGKVAAFDLDADTIKTALYTNAITPDMNVNAASSAYNAGQWATANEVFQAIQWPQGGVTLANKTISTPSSGVVKFDADDAASGSNFTGANIYGVLNYDATLAAPVANQGFCYNYLGGTNSVTGGQFNVIWHANGIAQATH